jgi:hypothetical protein
MATVAYRYAVGRGSPGKRTGWDYEQVKLSTAHGIALLTRRTIPVDARDSINPPGDATLKSPVAGWLLVLC